MRSSLLGFCEARGGVALKTFQGCRKRGCTAGATAGKPGGFVKIVSASGPGWDVELSLGDGGHAPSAAVLMLGGWPAGGARIVIDRVDGADRRHGPVGSGAVRTRRDGPAFAARYRAAIAMIPPHANPGEPGEFDCENRSGWPAGANTEPEAAK